MDNLKEVSKEEFKEFLDNYKGTITPNQWNENVIYYDFNRPSEYPTGSVERLHDCIIAKSCELFWLEDTSKDKYYILG